MNKWQLICPGVAVVIFLLVVGIMHGRNHSHYYTLSFSHAIGRELVEKTNSSHVVKIGPALQRDLSLLLGTTTQVSEVLLGDEPESRDIRASSRLVLTNSLGKGLVIRLRPAEEPELFHVLGYRRIPK